MTTFVFPHRLCIGGALTVATFFCVMAIAVVSRGAELDDHLKLLAQHGVKSDTADIIAYLQRLQPNEKLQEEIAELVEGLSSEEFNVREAAFKKLPTFGEAARGKLNEALKSKDPEVSWRAGKLLKELDSDDQSQTRQSLTQAALAVLKSKGDAQAAPTILATIPALSDEGTRGAACVALWACVDASHVDGLMKSLESKNIAQRAAAIVALEVAAAEPDAVKQAIMTIRPLLTDESPLVRLAAARALIDRDAKAAVATLVELTNAEDQEVLWQADALLHLKTGQQVEPAEQQTLGEAWRKWANTDLAKAELAAALGAKRLDLSAGRNTLEESFAVDQASLAKGYGRFQYEADNGGPAKVADGKLRIDGDNPEGDQRVYITSQRMLGRDRWPDKLEVHAKLAGEEGNNLGWHMGLSVGKVKVLFHPGYRGGAFRAETTDEHDYLFNNETMRFEPVTGVFHEMTIHVTRTVAGADFEVTVTGGQGGDPHTKKFSATVEQLGDYNRIGLERSGRTGGSALFDAVSIRLGR